MINGAEAMVQCLKAEGVTRIFGIPGVAIAPFYEALYNEPSITHVLVRQEQAAGHAASGYARITRRPAVCVTSSGPGATNLITALATAYADSIPLIAITVIYFLLEGLLSFAVGRIRIGIDPRKRRREHILKGIRLQQEEKAN